MVISHRYRFIFIKTRKTAGTSIEVLLSEVCAPTDVVTPIFPHVEPHVARNHAGLWNPLPELVDFGFRNARDVLDQLSKRKKFYNHIPARVARHRVPRRVWNGYYKFCVERNPWDKTLSHYHMLRHRSGGQLTLEQYFARGNFCFNYPEYTDADGALLVDDVVRFENLIPDLTRVFEHLDVPFDGRLPRAKSEYRADTSVAQNVLTTGQQDAVEHAFSREIAMHGYSLKDMAVRA
jgi:hypothetical protein